MFVERVHENCVEHIVIVRLSDYPRGLVVYGDWLLIRLVKSPGRAGGADCKKLRWCLIKKK